MLSSQRRIRAPSSQPIHPDVGVTGMKRHQMSALLCGLACLAWFVTTACSSSGGSGDDVQGTDSDTVAVFDATDSQGNPDIGVDSGPPPDVADVPAPPDAGDGIEPDVPVPPDVPEDTAVDVPEDIAEDVGVDIPPPECEGDGDCADRFDDLRQCELAACVGGTCVKAAAPSDVPCEDGNLCTTGDHCDARNCVSGTPVDCDDGIDCTADACDEATGCVQTPRNNQCSDGNVCTADVCSPTGGCANPPQANACDDGDACTLGDSCAGGECVGIPQSCSDNNPCNGVETCDPDRGCVAGPPPVCDNGIFCDGVEYCDQMNGECRSPGALTCEDDDPCTAGVCNEATDSCGQEFDPTLPDCDATPCTADTAAADCEDADVCTIDECVPVDGGPNGYCYNRDDPTCTHMECFGNIQCDDDDICTEDTCVPEQQLCWNVPIADCPVDCRRSADCDDENACTDDVCEAGGICAHYDAALPCDDGSVCTLADHCEAGECVAGSVRDCDDQMDCTFDTCHPTLGCQHEADPECGILPCTTDTDCDDGNSCTEGYCDTIVGFCELITLDGVVCDDGDACTVNERCDGTVCSNGFDRPCDDEQPCTLNLCNSTTGCYYETDTHCVILDPPCTTGQECNDGDLCTIDNCTFDGACHNDPQPGCGEACVVDADCNDQDPCTFNRCETNRCAFPFDPDCGANPCVTVADCNDGDECTIDICNPDRNLCEHPPVPSCGEPCVGDEDCDDGEPCTDDICNPDTDKCILVPIPDCERCFGPADCGDDNYCTDDTCPEGACVYVPNVLACDDSDFCTESDACSEGECVGEPVDCDDLDPCTIDTCDAVTGCGSVEDLTLEGCERCGLDADCDDGDSCTEDICNSLHCEYTELPYCTPAVCLDETACVDADPCTIDSCVLGPPSACFNIPVSPCQVDIPCETDADCDDTSPCTQTSCGANNLCIVLPTPPCGAMCSSDSDCDDGAPCTTDICEPQVGCVYVASADCVPCTDDAACNDGNECTEDDACAATGVCGSRLATEGMACTDVCITNPRCDGAGKCAGAPVECPESSEPCSVGVCDPAQGGCVFAVDPTDPFCNCTTDADCDDADPCTVDHCFPGEICRNIGLEGAGCSSTACTTGADCDDSDACTRDTCQPSLDACLHLQDPALCATVACTADIGCLDGDECTSEACSGSQCTWPANVALQECTPHKTCATDADCVTGRDDCVEDPETLELTCTFVPDPCAAGFCTDIGCAFVPIPMCGSTRCTAHADCDDANAATTDVCPAGGGQCFHLMGAN